MSLRERAIRAWKAYKPLRSYEEERKQEIRILFSTYFGQPPDGVYEDEVYCEDLKFLYVAGRFHLLGRCPSCNQEVWSVSITSLEDLGRILTEFEPEIGHSCEGGLP